MNTITHSGSAIARCFAIASTAFLLGSLSALPGDLDASFGTGGRTRFAHPDSSNITVRAAARMSDGRIVIAAQCRPSTGQVSFCLARINTDGSRDATFERTWHHSSIAGQVAIPYAIAVDTRDRVLVAGVCEFAATGSDMCVARFLSDGNIDGSFAFGHGFVTVAIGPGANPDQANAIVLTESGHIVLGGSCEMGSVTGADFCLAKFNENGERDTSFGVDGKTSAPWSSGVSGTDLMQALEQDNAGMLYAGGRCEVTSGANYFCLMSFNSNGSVFVRSSYAVSNAASLRSINAMALTYDNKLILTGRCSGGIGTGIDFCTIRVLLPGGEYDATFGNPRITPIGFQARDDTANSIIVQPDGRYVVAGTCGLNPSTIGDTFCFARYAPDGQEDRSINSNTDGVGSVYTEFLANSTNDRATVVLRSLDGGFVLIGNCERSVSSNAFDVCAAKYQSGTSLHAHCTPDIDGDGTINPLIDGIILARIASGIRTSAVMNGIATPSHALRRGWNSGSGIGAYLNNVCGVRGLSYAVLSEQ